jgi:BolA protein
MSHTPVLLLEQRLRQALSPEVLQINDHSNAHRNHAGSAFGGHFQVSIVSPLFIGKSSLQRHRMVYAAIQDLLNTGIHALSIDAKTPDESQTP